MGMRFEGMVCSSCKTVIEGSNFFTCPNCKSIIHNNDHCKNIHQMSCFRQRFEKRPLPVFDSERDIFK